MSSIICPDVVAQRLRVRPTGGSRCEQTGGRGIAEATGRAVRSAHVRAKGRRPSPSNLVEARFRKLLKARAREVHMCSPVQVDKCLLARCEWPQVATRGLRADHVVDHLQLRQIFLEVRILSSD